LHRNGVQRQQRTRTRCHACMNSHARTHTHTHARTHARACTQASIFPHAYSCAVRARTRGQVCASSATPPPDHKIFFVFLLFPSPTRCRRRLQHTCLSNSPQRCARRIYMYDSHRLGTDTQWSCHFAGVHCVACNQRGECHAQLHRTLAAPSDWARAHKPIAGLLHYSTAATKI
jgi:hypothetical protein